jgi:transposase
MPENPVFVGIDVSKARLDVHLHPLGQSFTVGNDRKGRAELLGRLASHAIAGIGLEASGGYERDVARALSHAGHAVRLLDPARVRAFAKALGKRAKTDRIDAQVIARATVQLEGAAPELDPDRLRLRELLAQRAALIEQRAALIEQRKVAVQQLARQEDACLKRLTRRLIAHFNRLVTALERAIDALVKEVAAFRKTTARLTTAPGVGPILAATLLARLPELGHAPPRAIGALAGVVPYTRQSGSRDSPRHVAGGRADLRAVLYMATLSAVRANLRLRAFYRRLREAGKPAKVALVAAMRKLLAYLDAMLRKGQDWAEQPLPSHS